MQFFQTGDGGVRAMGSGAEPPADLVDQALLVTDIVGSSELHRRYPVEMLETIERHDRILREVIARFGGRAFKHTGDGLMAVFDSASGAVLAARTAFFELMTGDWGKTGRPKLRWGLHAGLMRPRGDDFFGHSLTVVSRLESAASADQILASEAIVKRIDPADIPGCSFADLGEHHFKGTERTRVFQLQAEGLPRDFPPISGKREIVEGNLPAELSSFIGRARELAVLHRLADSSRLVTLVGAGGIGKTRLAIEFARTRKATASQGVWVLHLASVEQRTDLWPVLATTLGMDVMPGADPRMLVLNRLRDARAVLLMDNCEHVIEQAAEMAQDLCRSCTNLLLIATTRQNLAVEGEAIFAVPSLAPAKNEKPEASSGSRLFVERARLARHDFEPSAQDMKLVAQICDRLDHIPLAIEIAAAQLRRYPLPRIHADAKNPLELDSARGQRRVSHQQTLRRTFDWSYGLIGENSRRVLRILGVFAGPFHEEQAIELCAAEFSDETDVLDSIDELIDASLLATGDEGARLLRMLRPVQAFAREKLEEEGRLEEFERRHAEVFARRAAALGAQFVTSGEKDAAAAIVDGLDNMRAAFDRAMEKDNLELAAGLAAPLFLYNYYHRGAETASWATAIMTRPGSDDLPQAAILLASAAGNAFHEGGDPSAALQLLDRGFAAEAAGASSSRGWLSHVRGQVAFWRRERDQVLANHERAIGEAGANGDEACRLISMCFAAFHMATTGDKAGARALLDDLEALGGRVSQPSMIGYVHFARAGLAARTDIPAAIRELEAAVEWAEIGGNWLASLRLQRVISDLMARAASPPEAVQLEIAALARLPEHGATIYVWTTVARLLAPLARMGADVEAAVLAGALDRSPLTLGRSEQAALEQARQRLDADGFRRAIAKGRQLDQAGARAFALALKDRLASPGAKKDERG